MSLSLAGYYGLTLGVVTTALTVVGLYVLLTGQGSYFNVGCTSFPFFFFLL